MAKEGPNGSARAKVRGSHRSTPKLDKAIRKRLLELIEAHGEYKLACDLVGIDYTTFHRWRTKGREAGSGPLFTFDRQVDRAMAAWEAASCAIVDEAGKDFEVTEEWAEQWTKGEGSKQDRRAKLVKRRRKVRGDWRAVAWRLERRYPTKYGNRQSIEVAGKLEVVDAMTILRKRMEDLDKERFRELPPTARGGTGHGGNGGGQAQ